MRSSHADYFNHDDDAPDYDQDVTREENPIRAGYSALLSWVGGQVAPGSRVVDLGAGTGNTVAALPASCTVTAVDVSLKMSEIARAKLSGRSVEFVQADVLEYAYETDLRQFDSIVSTYTLHHLTPEERVLLFSLLRHGTRRGAVIAIGDLMYQNQADRMRIITTYQSNFPELASDFGDEFFWEIESSDAALRAAGWTPTWRRFADLSWGLRLTN